MKDDSKAIVVLTQTVQQVNIGLRVLTRPMPAKLPELYRTLGTDYAERVLPSIIQVGSSALSLLTWIERSLLVRHALSMSRCKVLNP